MSTQGRLGRPQSSRRQALALGKLFGKSRQHLPGSVQLPQPDSRHHQVSHGKIGDISSRIGGQVLLQ